ncbi:MAG: tRNA epoxyqueuosine(34) reductase QueG [Syntrophaceae bacterium]
MRTKEAIISLAHSLNIDLIGFTDALPLSAGAERFLSWLDTGLHGGMHWLRRRPDARYDPADLLDDAQTVICIAMSYYTAQPGASFAARYAYGWDYHLVLTDKLTQILAFLRQADPGLKAKICVDTSPLAEKPLAQKAGLGWQGRNTLLVNDCYGSWLCLGELIINRAYAPDRPATKRCGTCRACLQACPTGAIRDDGSLDAGRCLSYISSYDDEPHDLRGTILGCDICQSVCPFNRRPLPSRETPFLQPNALTARTVQELRTLSREAYETMRKDTAFSRLPYARFQRNLVRAGFAPPEG